MATIVANMKTNGVIKESDVGVAKVATRYFEMLEAQTPLELVAAFSAVNAVHTIAHDAAITAGNFTITVRLQNGESFTTGNIAFNANAAAIESAINSAATSASITGWTNGDISVSGGSIDTADVVLTFDGDSVSGANHPLTTVADVDLADGTVGTVTQTAIGHPNCEVIQLLHQQGPINVPTLDDPSTWVRETYVSNVPRSVAEVYALQAAKELQNDAAYTKVMSLLGY